MGESSNIVICLRMIGARALGGGLSFVLKCHKEISDSFFQLPCGHNKNWLGDSNKIGKDGNVVNLRYAMCIADE